MILDSYLDMEKFIPNRKFWHLFRVIEKHGGALRFVGGAVRDALAGVPGYDYDLATNLSPDELMEACQEGGIKTFPLGIKFGTLGVLVDDVQLEITSLRKDIKTDGRHTEVEFTDDWIEDASRRDLTINAVYADEHGNVFDYFNGIDDLKNGIVRFIGNPTQRISEDYLRILRFFRFYSAFGKTPIDEKALKACVNNKENLKKLSIERIRDELIKMLKTKNVVNTLKIMYDNGILDYIFPQSNNLQNLQYLIDMVNFLQIEPSELRRLFILYNPDETMATNLAERLHMSKKYREQLLRWAKFKCCAKDFENPQFIKENVYRYGKEFCRDKLLLSFATELKDYKDIQTIIQQIDMVDIPIFPIRGQDIINMANIPEKYVGNVIKSLENCWIAHGFIQDKTELLLLAQEVFNALIDNRRHA